MFSRVLVANRGEIAVRVMRTLREMGIASVAVYSEADRNALFAAYADEAYLIGAGPPSESYLNVERILDAAKRSGAEAIHPGYGFLAENAPFARACAEAGIVFIGPPPEAIEAMGSKIRARQLMAAAGVPIVPGTTEPVGDVEAARGIAAEIGYPVAVKAAAGGGGKGFRVAMTERDLAEALEGARRESERFFADSVVYLERYLPEPRHVEIQVLADAHGTCLWLGERDCSIQRRHQKLVEETPSPVVSASLRRRMGEASVRAAEAVGYRSAGTCEYLVAGDEFFFLEMNARIQVEHPVTEMVLGVDLVREQVRIAAGEPLGLTQKGLKPRGHAIECRINAEDASHRFLPAPAPIGAYREPSGPGVRVDSGVGPGSDLPDLYDPMIAKLIVWDVDREAARRRMLRALDEFHIEGPVTLLPFHRWLLEQEEFIAGGACHALLAELAEKPTPIPAPPGRGAIAAAAASDGGAPVAQTERRLTAEVDGRRFDVRLFYEPQAGDARRAAAAPARKRAGRRAAAAASGGGEGGGSDTVTTPMQGTVLRVLVEEGQEVAEGDVICIVEAMKMENEVAALRAGTVRELNVGEGEAVQAGQVIAVVA